MIKPDFLKAQRIVLFDGTQWLKNSIIGLGAIPVGDNALGCNSYLEVLMALDAAAGIVHPQSPDEVEKLLNSKKIVVIKRVGGGIRPGMNAAFIKLENRGIAVVNNEILGDTTNFIDGLVGALAIAISTKY